MVGTGPGNTGLWNARAPALSPGAKEDVGDGGEGMGPGTQRARGSSFVKVEGRPGLEVRETRDSTWSGDSASRGMMPRAKVVYSFYTISCFGKTLGCSTTFEVGCRGNINEREVIPALSSSESSGTDGRSVMFSALL